MALPKASSGTQPLHVLPARRVFVRDLEIMASVGIFEIEKRYEQRVVVSIELDVHSTKCP